MRANLLTLHMAEMVRIIQTVLASFACLIAEFAHRHVTPQRHARGQDTAHLLRRAGRNPRF